MKDRTRREFLKDGLAVTAGVVASGVLGNTGTVCSARSTIDGKAFSPLDTTKKKRSNIMLIITDQQRQAQHWPTGWIEEHMPTMARLQRHGVTFTNNFTAASACSPSRSKPWWKSSTWVPS